MKKLYIRSNNNKELWTAAKNAAIKDIINDSDHIPTITRGKHTEVYNLPSSVLILSPQKFIEIYIRGSE